MTRKLLYVPLGFAELLHATLGPLGDVLADEDHNWAPMVQRVLAEYTARRDQMLVNLHGENVLPLINDHTLACAEEVEHMVNESIDDTMLGIFAEEA